MGQLKQILLAVLLGLGLNFLVLRWVGASRPEASPMQPTLSAAHNMEIMQIISGSFSELAIENNRLYVFNDENQEILVFDISNPLSPAPIGVFPTDSAVSHFVASENVLYTLMDDTLQIIDMENPALPLVLATYSGLLNFPDLVVRDKIAYFPWGESSGWPAPFNNWGGLYILNLQDPANPLELVNFETPDEANTKIVLQGRYVYILWRDYINYDIHCGFRVVDISNPSNPLEVFFSRPVKAGSCPAIIIEDNLLMISGAGCSRGGCSSETDIFDISIPAAPAAAGSIMYGSSLAAIKDHVYLGNSSGLHAVDISDPLTRVEIGYIGTITPTQMVEYDSYVYFLDYFQDLYITRFAISETIGPGISSTLIYTYAEGTITTVETPPGVVTDSATLYLAPVPNLLPKVGSALVGPGFDLIAYQGGVPKPGLMLSQAMTIGLTYNEGAVQGILDKTQLRLDWWDGTTWRDAAATCDPPSTYQLDLDGNEIQIPICQLGRFAFTGPTRVIFLPVGKHNEGQPR